MMTPHFLAEDWPVRFVALMSMLEDMTAQAQPVHRPFIVNDWVIVVSGLLERLPRDLSLRERLTLMRHSVLESFRQSAVRYTSDVNQQNDFLRATYPRWLTVEDLLDEYEAWAAQQIQLTHH